MHTKATGRSTRKGVSDFAKEIVGLVIVLVIFAAVAGTAYENLDTLENNSALSSGEAALIGVIGLVFAAFVVLRMLDRV